MAAAQTVNLLPATGRWSTPRNPFFTDGEWPLPGLEAHRFLYNAYRHLRNRDSFYDTLDARMVLHTAMVAVGEAL